MLQKHDNYDTAMSKKVATPTIFNDIFAWAVFLHRIMCT